MCTGAEIVALVGATAATGGAVMANENARKSRNAAKDAALKAESDQRAAEAGAAQSANAAIAMRKRALQSQSLVTGAGVSEGGKSTLGGG
jgi:hypothetical protein